MQGFDNGNDMNSRQSNIRPVFIIGCQRSGTTFLGSLLGGHSECVCVPEAQFKFSLVRDSSEVCGYADLFERLSENWRFKIWGISYQDIKPFLSASQGSPKSLLVAAVRAFAEKVGRREPSMWIDHTPENIWSPDVLLEAFPNAKIIHIVRDGRATAASVLPLDWGPNEILSASEWWDRSIAMGLELESRMPEHDLIMRVRYEDLVQAPDEILTKLCVFLGLEFEPEMVTGKGFKAPGYTAKQHAMVGSAPSLDSMSKWQKTLSKRQIEIFEMLSGRYLQELHYDLLNPAGVKPLGLFEKLKFKLLRVFKALYNRWAYRGRRLSSGLE